MERADRKLSVFCSAVLCLFLLGCDKTSPSYSILPDEQIFQQSSEGVITKIDILWVIDNSGSMETSQTNIANNFSAFIDKFQEKEFDYQIAVIATDAFRAQFGQPDSIAEFVDAGGAAIITPSTPNLAQNFIDNVQVGITGYGDERGLHSMRESLTNPINAGYGFPRPDAFLAVIIVSDEDDFSIDQDVYIKNQYDAYTDPANPFYADAQNHTIDAYVNFLDTLTSSSATFKKYSVNSIVIPDVPTQDAACLAALNQPPFTGRIYGTRYGQLSLATEGIVASLCGDFADELQVISEGVLQLATQFLLDREPKPETIVVKVNGQLVPNVNENPGPLTGGWEYIPESQAIRFSGDYIPAQNATISVNFDPVQLDF